MSYTARMIRGASWRPLHWAVVVGAFLAVRVAMVANGLRFQDDPAGQIHLLDLTELRADPFLAFTDLHIQPPLFNFFVGAVLRWSPFPAAVSFQVLYLAMGLITVLVLRALLVDLGARAWSATIATVAVALSPLAIRNEAVLTYETPTTMILVLSVFTFLGYVRRPGVLRLVLFTTTLVVGVLTRTTLNPLWFLGAVVLVVLARPPGRAWRPVAATITVAVVLVALPAVHNQIRFDTLGYSSFVGMNLSRATVLQLPRVERDRLIADGELSPAAAVVPYSFYDEYADLFGPCRAHTGSPVLDDVVKASSGDRNMNAECYLPAYRQARSDAVAALRADPGAYLRAVAASALVYPRWDVHAADPGNGLWRTWVRVYAPLTLPVPIAYTPLGADAQPYAKQVTDLVEVNRFSLTVAFGLVLAVVYGIRALVRIRRGRATPAEWARVYIAFTVVCITAVSVLFDSFENARFREPLDPLLLGPVYVLVIDGVRRLLAAFGSHRRSAASGAP